MSFPLSLKKVYADWAWLLLVLALFGLSWADLHRSVFLILALIGVYQLLRHGKALSFDPEVRLLALLFGCLWLPMLTSIPDAENAVRSLGAVTRYLIYFLAGVAVMSLPWSAVSSRRLWTGVTVLLVFWASDGLLQFVSGANVLGYAPFDGGRLTGMFDRNPRLGPVLTVLSPLYFEWVRRFSLRSRIAWLLLMPYLAVIFLGGSRVSWLLLAVSIALYGWYLVRLDRRTFSSAKWLRRGVAGVLFTALLFTQVDWLSERVVPLMDLASGDYQRVNAATSLRLPLWQAAWEMASEHWFNGVGARNYGTVFLECCYQGQVFTNQINAHPHLYIGEVAAETGLLGVIGYVGFLFAILRAIFRQAPSPRQVWLISGFLAAFPLSSTLSFYAIFSSALLWSLLLAWLVLERQARQENTEMEKR